MASGSVPLAIRRPACSCDTTEGQHAAMPVPELLSHRRRRGRRLESEDPATEPREQEAGLPTFLPLVVPESTLRSEQNSGRRVSAPAVQTLAEGGAPDDQRYADWIEQYASEEFAEATAFLRGELDRLAEHAGPEKRDRLRYIFLVSSRYELLFWEMCWEGEAPLVPGS